MSKHAIQSLERSINALEQRIGTESERQPDREMVRYLRGRISEIENANKKRSVARKQTDQEKTDPAVAFQSESVPESKNKGNHRSTPDCDCGLCTDPMPVCGCELCRQCRDEQAALIGLNGTDADLRFVNSEVQR